MKVKLGKGSIHSAVSYGNEAQGLAPQRLKQLRLQLARTAGLQTGGSLDILYDQHEDLIHPWESAVERQLQAFHKFLNAWPPGQLNELEQAWMAS